MRMRLHARAVKAAITIAAILAATAAFAQTRKYDPGASDTEIRIGQTMPYSGPLSSVSVKLDLLLPGLSVNTSPTDYRVVKEFRMMRFSGERWEPFGPMVTD